MRTNSRCPLALRMPLNSPFSQLRTSREWNQLPATSSPGLFPQKMGGAPLFFQGKSPGDEVELPADRRSVVSIASRVQGESDYFYELQSKLA